MTIGLVLLLAAYILIYAGVKGVHPWGPIVEAFGGKAPPPPGSTSEAPGRTKQAAAGYEPVVAAGGLTDRAAACKEAIDRQYPNLEYLGGFNCRHIIPHGGGESSEWSEHAWSNAIDYGGDAGTMRKLMVWATLNKVRFRIVNIIPPGSAVNAVHLDFAPSHTGQTPPCAGGGGRAAGGLA